MFPIFLTLEFNAGSLRTWGFAAALGLTLYILWDGLRSHGRARWVSTLLSAGAFFTVSAWAAYFFLTPERLPAGQFGLPLRTYGLMTVIGMVTCFFIQRHFGRKVGLSADQILTLWVYGGLASLTGARGLHVLVNRADYAADPMSAFAFWDGGLAFIGAAVIGMSFAVIYLRQVKLPILRSLDALTLGIALTHGFGRLGCFFAGCCYGRQTELPWGVSFPVGSIAQYTLAQMGVITEFAGTAHRHPTQIYEAAATFVIGGLLLLWYTRRRPRAGMIVTGYMLAYPVIRFFLELVRDDPEREFVFRFPEVAPRLLSTTQLVALILIPVGLGVLRWLKNHPEEAQAAASDTSESAGCMSDGKASMKT